MADPTADPASLAVPTVHLNGTSRAALVDGYSKAYAALKAARDALAATAPNGRDYYPQGPDAIREATKQHAARMKRLVEVENEIERLGLAIYA